MIPKFRYLVECLLAYSLIFMFVRLDFPSGQVTYFPIPDIFTGVTLLAQGAILVLIFPELRLPHSIKSIVFGIISCLLVSPPTEWSLNYVVIPTALFMIWSIMVGWFCRLYQKRSQHQEAMGPVQLRVKNDKIGIVLPRDNKVRWFSPSKGSEALKYISNSSVSGCSGVRYDYDTKGSITVDELRTFGNSLVSK